MTVRQSVDQLARALYVKGPRPDIHDRQLARLKAEWPTLHTAIVGVIHAQECACQVNEPETPVECWTCGALDSHDRTCKHGRDE